MAGRSVTTAVVVAAPVVGGSTVVVDATLVVAALAVVVVVEGSAVGTLLTVVTTAVGADATDSPPASLPVGEPTGALLFPRRDSGRANGAPTRSPPGAHPPSRTRRRLRCRYVTAAR